MSTFHCAGLAMVGVLLTWTAPALGQVQPPRLAFSDLTSGPKVGNSDTALGQVAGQDGAIVTVWGTYLGATQGSSRVLVNGSEARVYSWGNAVAPANLFERHGMQMVSFQLAASTPDSGDGITVVVGGRTSNALPFTVRSGSIYFVAVGGDDGGVGSFAQPWAGIQHAADTLADGDIAYLRDGVSKVVSCNEYAACVNLYADGAPDRPKALVAYPGATVTVGSDSAARAVGVWNVGTGTGSIHWVIAKLTIPAATDVAFSASTGFRVVGNFIAMPNGDGQAGAIYVTGNHAAVLGNELTNLAATNPNASKLFHSIYVSGPRSMDPPRLPTEFDREIAWNYLHDNVNNRGINIYSEQAYAALLENHRVHDNVIINQRGVGILLGNGMTGDNWVYNNVVDQAGLGPDWSLEGVSGHTCMQIDVGADTTPATTTTLHVLNNTLSRCGYGPSENPEPTYLGASGAISFGDIFARATVWFQNNIVFSEGNPYLSPWTTNSPPADDYTNLWFGDGAAPTWDTAAINADPAFVNAAAHDLRLLGGSAAVDVGIDLSATVAFDLDGNARPQGAGFELGAYEVVIVCDGPEDCVTPPACRSASGASCIGGVCAYAALADDTPCGADSNACTDDVCRAGACAHPGHAGASCDDGNACTLPDLCSSAGVCIAGPDTCPCAPTGQVRDCYSGPPSSVDVGSCRGGSQTCQANNTWSVCAGEVTPVAEICGDALDGDCDALADASDPSCSITCADLDGDAHASAQCGGDDCDDDAASVSPAAPELCEDGRDNDCDGLTDADDADCANSAITGGCSCGAGRTASGLVLLFLFAAGRRRRARSLPSTRVEVCR